MADLECIREIPLRSFDSIIASLSASVSVQLHPNDLRACSKKACPDLEARHIETLVRQLVSLKGLLGETGLSAQTLLAGLFDGVSNSQDPIWTPEEIDKWKSIEPKLEVLLNSNSVRTVAKALDLSYEYQNLLRAARIITDLRPVFNDDAKSIDGAVVSHTLSLKYDGADGDHSLGLALDESDIRTLRAECDRALIKAETAKRRFEQAGDLRVVVSGREPDEAT